MTSPLHKPAIYRVDYGRKCYIWRCACGARSRDSYRTPEGAEIRHANHVIRMRRLDAARAVSTSGN